MARKDGSGLHNATTAAVERLVATVFANRPVKEARDAVDRYVQAGRCGIDARTMTVRLAKIAESSGLEVVVAESPSPDHLGDVRLTLRDGSFVWIEVKAQTTKAFRDLIQADWVRDETDAIRFLLQHDETFAGLAGAWLAESLDVSNPKRYFDGWSFGQLWAADVALLPTRARRLAAGVAAPSDLHVFLSRKYVLHIAQDGARFARLDRIPALATVIDGGQVHLTVSAGGKADVKVDVSTLGAPRRGNIEFVYYTGYEDTGVLGRHKLTDFALSRTENLLVAR